ncbi:hypothetical protein FACS189499_06680 [Clostridia bacterium]|nr:hypothetical protein FACS189499_06680 [Clostridia bacterium]
MSNRNKKIGNEFEEMFSQLLFDNGFWVHKLYATEAGQPADIIAVKNRRAYLIDCKVCTDGSFVLSRIEDNQDSAMTLWEDCGNGEALFALLVDGEIYMATYGQLQTQTGRVSEEWIKANCPTWEELI